MNDQFELATFGAGCFWGVEARFRELKGVLDATSGYMGGQPNPTYEAVCSGGTGHAEVVQVRFDPQQLNFETLLALFFDMHNPTTLNRQGPDVGTQYRSAIFYHDESQKETAEKLKAAFDTSGEFRKPIVTEITEAKEFWKAEDYHQDYFEKNPNHPACHVVDMKEILSDK